MEQQKYSGIEWVGMIPQRWKVAPIGAYFYEVLNKNYDGAVKKALKFTYGNIVEKNNFDADSDEYVSSTIRKYTVVEPGTIMLNGLNLNFDFVTQRIGLVNTKGVITSSYVAFKSINEEYYNSKYANYLFKSYDFCKAFHNMGGGVRKILNFGELRKQYCVIPPINEQKAIVDFLDNKCSEIDSLVADIKKEISILEEYKKTVITEAVTKGITHCVEMKNSPCPWIGAVPSHWVISKLKYKLRRNDVKNRGNCTVLSLYREYGVIPKDSRDDNHNVTSEDTSKYKFVRVGDFVINKMKAWQGSVAVSSYEGIVSPAYYVYNFTDNSYNKKYFHYLIRSCYKDEFRRLSGGIREGQWDLPSTALDNVTVLCPPIEEQNKIAEYLDKKTSVIEKTISEKQSQLEILAEYKKSIIYEYVTGKKEVI
jgi:type I restriction enzyme S subunit